MNKTLNQDPNTAFSLNVPLQRNTITMEMFSCTDVDHHTQQLEYYSNYLLPLRQTSTSTCKCLDHNDRSPPLFEITHDLHMHSCLEVYMQNKCIPIGVCGLCETFETCLHLFIAAHNLCQTFIYILSTHLFRIYSQQGITHFIELYIEINYTRTYRMQHV